MPEQTDRPTPVAGTIVARNYLPAALVLADSYQRHHPGAGFTVLVVDADHAERSELAARAPGVRILDPGELDLGVDEFGRMAMAYSVTELCTAVKPWLLRRLLAEHDVAIYLDPDIEVFGQFGDAVAQLATEHDIALTPHVLEPMPRDGLRPTEADIMASGVFNLGFIAVSTGASRFLDFWAERLRHDAISAITEQLFTDQRWVDNVPAMFRHTVITDPGYNVAYWNVYQRPLAENADGTITAASAPLRFYHYSGYRPEKPWLASTHYADKPRVLLSEQPLLARLFAGYRRQLIDAGYAQALDDVPYRWNTLPDGTRVSLSLRRAFRQAWVEAERAGQEPPSSPFGTGNAEDFLRWATEPADVEQQRTGMNRWAMAVWRSRADLRQAFPDPLGDHADEFRAWCATSGAVEGELSSGAVPARRPVRAVPVLDTLGANVLGYLTAELGVGEMGRLVHEAIEASGLPMATAVEEFTVGNRTGHPLPEGAVMGEPRYPVSVLCVNADMTATTLRLHPELSRDRYLIGLWSWELSVFPPVVRSAFNLVNEVWTISDFCADAIAEHAHVPVHTFPVPVRDPLGGTAVIQSARRSTDGQTRFLFVFDHNSVFDRKNPTAAVTAFQRAFADRGDVRLVIKSINGEQHPADRERLRAAAAGDGRIELIEHYLGHDEVRKLFATADCYLSLHRSEGFGLTVAEAMAHGLPVIATDYAGTTELLTDEVGWPVPYRLVPVGEGNPPYPADAQWAEPDLDAAAAALREVADQPQRARRRGLAARRHVLATRSRQLAADWVRARISAGYRQWRAAGTTRGPLPGPAAPMREARVALRWRADVTAPSRLPGASTMRRAVLRTIDHYDQHQRNVLGALMDGVERSVVALSNELVQWRADTAGQLHRLDDELAGLRCELTEQLDQRLAKLDQRLTEQLAADRANLDRVRCDLDHELAARAQRIDALDQKLVTMLAERDHRLGVTETAVAHLQREWRSAVPAVRQGLLRHHDLLSPPPATPTEAVPTDLGVLRLPADDTVVLPWLRTYGSWEADESRLVDLLLPPGGVFVDIGAHVGYFTVRALQRVGADGLVVAVEPWRLVRDLLEHNVAANVPAAFTEALVVLDVAAWDADGPLRLALSAEGNSGDNRVDPAGQIEVTGCRLDGLPLLAERRIDVVKSDAQGRDHRALAGMAGLLRSHRPHVLCEFWPEAIMHAGDDPATVLRQYRALGYRPVPLTADLVTAVETAANASVPSGGPGPTDHELVEAARSAAEGFVTLWLRPPT